MYSPFFSAPAWSISKRQKAIIKVDKNRVPVGTYHPKDGGKLKSNNPAWTYNLLNSIGNQNRVTYHSKKGPGPGQYHTEQNFFVTYHYKIGPKYTMNGRSNSSYNVGIKTPGPGQYNPLINQIKQRMPAFSMYGRDDVGQSKKQIPGPGEYHQQSNNKIGGKGISFGKSVRPPLNSTKNTLVGPGKYDNNYNPIKSAQIKFGNSTRGQQIQKDKVMPGRNSSSIAGQYNIPNQIANNALNGATLLSRKSNPAEAMTTNVPGPGSYNHQKGSNLRGTSYSIGNTKRQTFKTKETPGPGNYQYRKDQGKGITFTKGPRGEINKKGNYPGPGIYNTQDYLLKSKGPMDKLGGTQNYTKNFKDTPGPGQYDHTLKGNVAHSKEVGIGTSMRSGLGYSAMTPGPGMYNMDEQPVGPKWSFAYGQRLGEKIELKPGPPDYKIPSLIADLPTYVLTSKGFGKTALQY